MDVLVLYRPDVAEAEEVAREYAAARSIPDSHLCAVSGLPTFGPDAIDFDTYSRTIASSLDGCLAAAPSAEEIDYLVLVRGFPYLVTLPDGGFTVSVQGLLQIHRARLASGAELAGTPQIEKFYPEEGLSTPSAHVENPFYLGNDWEPRPDDFRRSNFWERFYVTATAVTRQAELPASFSRRDAGAHADWDFTDNLFIVSALDGFDMAGARALIERGASADGTHPTATLLCMAGADEPRGARDPECEYATRLLAGAGLDAQFIEHDFGLSGRSLAAYFTGASGLHGAIDGNTYVPGAIADNLTSFGAASDNFFRSTEVQTSIARFVEAGITGVHGTANEPINDSFPNAGTMMLYTFGYSMGESWFFNQRYLYWQNVYVGDPLTTPYATRPTVTIDASGSVPANAPITVGGNHANGIASVRLYGNGRLIAQSETDSLVANLESFGVGEEVELLGIATATNAAASRPGWDESMPMPRPDVQGWSSVTVTVGMPADLPDTGVFADAGVGSDGGTSRDGSGCSAGGSGAGGLLVWLWLIATGRRRRTAR